MGSNSLQFIMSLLEFIFGFGFLLEELHETFLGSCSIVVNNGVVISSHELEGWESTDLEVTWSIIGSCVHLGNDDRVDTAEGLCNFTVDWSQLLTVATPWCVEFNQNILCSIHGNCLEVVTDEDSNSVRVIGVLWDWLRSDDRCELTSLELGQPSLDSSSSKFIRLREWEVVSTIILSGEGWELVTREGHLLGHLLVLDTREPDEREVLLEFWGDFLELGDGTISGFLLSWINKEPEDWDTTVNVGSVVLWSDLINKTKRVTLDELGNGIITEFSTVHGLLLIEGLEDNDGLHLLISNEGSISDLTEGEVVTLLVGELVVVGIEITTGLGEGDNNWGFLLVLGDERVNGFLGVKDLDSWSSLTLHEVDNILGGTTTFVVGGLTITEELEGWVSLNLVLSTNLGLGSCVNLCDGNFSSLQLSSGSFVFWGQLLAVTAPWSVELNQHDRVGLELLIKI
mmetsp:Transcript_57715/g.80097  ORF Transcript_57715/g.80097 Transcript_57715/m.80097 type:complete len:456 (+) Transcript_57715:240-1607(+)